MSSDPAATTNAPIDQPDGPVLVALILTRDEERQIADAITSATRVADVVVVLDSNSTDRTREISEGAGAVVWSRPFDDFSSQRNAGIDRIVETYNPAWVLTIDADERLSDRLADEISNLVRNGNATHDVYLMKRRVRFAGKVLRFGGHGNIKLARLFRPSAGHFEKRPVNEHFEVVPGGRIGTLQGLLLHEDVTSWERHIDKHNRYSTFEAQARFDLLNNPSTVKLSNVRAYGSLRRRWMREHIFNRLPVKPLFRFLQVYIFLGGFLDGGAGFKNALFIAWQEMCTDMKFQELVESSRSSTKPS